MKVQQEKEEKSYALQWHPAFFAGIQIEFGEEAKYLEFKQEYALGTKPMMIDVLIKKEEGRILQKNIGKIFRKYNIIEYKSPEDYLSIDDYYKVYAYTYFYKSDRIPIDSVKLEDLTISLVSERYPQKLFRHLKEERRLRIEKMFGGIYYVIGETIPLQIIVTSRLSAKSSLWLRNLTNRMKSYRDAEELVKDYEKHQKNPLYESVMNIIVHANETKFTEVKNMCEALKELMKDELEAEREEGKQEILARINKLTLRLSELGRIDDIIKAAADEKYQEKLFQEFDI